MDFIAGFHLINRLHEKSESGGNSLRRVEKDWQLSESPHIRCISCLEPIEGIAISPVLCKQDSPMRGE